MSNYYYSCYSTEALNKNDPNEELFKNIIKGFATTNIKKEELKKLGIGNSLSGAKGIYATGNGLPDIVINDSETSLGSEPYSYKIEVYQIQDNKNAERLFNEVVKKVPVF